jgi:hypothetical protein
MSGCFFGRRQIAVTPWVERSTIDLALDGPPNDRLAGVPGEVITAVNRLLDFIRSEMPPTAQRLVRLLNWRTMWRFHREARDVARFAGVDWREVLLANLVYDFVVSQLGCSTIALPTPHGPVLARNMDFWPEDLLAQASYLVRYTRCGKVVFVQAGWPGAIGIVSGQSSRGFAVVLNAVASPEKLNLLGYPVLLQLRRVVEDARDFDQALALLANKTLATSALFTLVGTENRQRVVIERSPRHHALRWPTGDEPLVTTNDFRLMYQPTEQSGHRLYESTCHRYDALCHSFAGHRPEQDVDDTRLLYVLSDPSVIQTITAQHVIFRPRRDESRLFVPRRLLIEPP